MKLLRSILWLLVFLLYFAWPVVPAAGQTVITTGPVTINDNVAWTIAMSDAATAAAAQALPLRIRDNGLATFVSITATGCVAAPIGVDGWNCTTKVSVPLAAMVNVRGTHSLTATWVDSAGVESPASVPFVLTTPAGAPTGLRFTR